MLLFRTILFSLLLVSGMPVIAQATPENHANLKLALERANSGIDSNAEWQAFYPEGFLWEFDAVPMLLVPAGCFQMGNDDEAYYWEDSNVVIGVPDGAEQCFDTAFWIDQTEVTQAQFVALGGTKLGENYFEGENRPVDNIIWYEARDYCEKLRGGRLPTEAEWEYAARGIDGLFFPWGNEFNGENLIWNRSTTEGTADVGTIPAGASWVGALDMAGNLWEWTNSVYAQYPFIPNPEFENPEPTSLMSLRGGSFDSLDASGVRSSTRVWYCPAIGSPYDGFRCIRELDEEDS